METPQPDYGQMVHGWTANLKRELNKKEMSLTEISILTNKAKPNICATLNGSRKSSPSFIHTIATAANIPLHKVFKIRK